MKHPYKIAPKKSFWANAITPRNMLEIEDLWHNKLAIKQSDKIITAGSCFAQHISKALRAAKYNWRNYEPAPEILLPSQQLALNYGVYSFRTGNIYTVKLLRQWLTWAFDATIIERSEEVWENDGRFYDPFRPSIEPKGFESAEEVIASRNSTLRAIKSAFLDADVFIFTLGLTEGWRNVENGETYATCPGTNAGHYDPQLHTFTNFRYPDMASDADWIVKFLQNVNPKLRILLTVSPVPLAATATGNHVLPATTYSKSVLRAIAGDLADAHTHIDYFPSYEIISSFPYRGSFYKPDMREVSDAGVAHVMQHFMAGLSSTLTKTEYPVIPKTVDMDEADYIVCEEEILRTYA